MFHSSSKLQFATLFALNAVSTGICGGVAFSYLPTASAAPRIMKMSLSKADGIIFSTGIISA